MTSLSIYSRGRSVTTEMSMNRQTKKLEQIPVDFTHSLHA
jgi:hypothetical protein